MLPTTRPYQRVGDAMTDTEAIKKRQDGTWEVWDSGTERTYQTIGEAVEELYEEYNDV